MSLRHDDRGLIRQLFASATGIASICEEWATKGQSSKLTLNEYDYANWELGKAIESLQRLQGGIQTIVNLAGCEIKGPKR